MKKNKSAIILFKEAIKVSLSPFETLRRLEFLRCLSTSTEEQNQRSFESGVECMRRVAVDICLQAMQVPEETKIVEIDVIRTKILEADYTTWSRDERKKN